MALDQPNQKTMDFGPPPSNIYGFVHSPHVLCMTVTGCWWYSQTVVRRNPAQHLSNVAEAKIVELYPWHVLLGLAHWKNALDWKYTWTHRMKMIRHTCNTANVWNIIWSQSWCIAIRILFSEVVQSMWVCDFLFFSITTMTTAGNGGIPCWTPRVGSPREEAAQALEIQWSILGCYPWRFWKDYQQRQLWTHLLILGDCHPSMPCDHDQSPSDKPWLPSGNHVATSITTCSSSTSDQPPAVPNPWCLLSNRIFWESGFPQ